MSGYVAASVANAARAKRRRLNSSPSTTDVAVQSDPTQLSSNPEWLVRLAPLLKAELARPRPPLRDVLEAFADGTDSLHGFPRHLVDWPALWAYCERNDK